MSNETDGADLFELRRSCTVFAVDGGSPAAGAIDLFVGRQMRPHADIDVAILRDDQVWLRDRLPDTRVDKVVDGQLVPWGSSERLELPIHEVHVTWPDGFHLGFLLNEWDSVSEEWMFRRAPRIRRSVDSVFAMGRGLPRLAPESCFFTVQGVGAEGRRGFRGGRRVSWRLNSGGGCAMRWWRRRRSTLGSQHCGSDWSENRQLRYAGM